MATFESKYLVDEIIRNNGHYKDDPQVKCIVEFEIVGGGIRWAVCWLPAEVAEVYRSPYVINPRVIFKAEEHN